MPTGCECVACECAARDEMVCDRLLERRVGADQQSGRAGFELGRGPPSPMRAHDSRGVTPHVLRHPAAADVKLYGELPCRE